MSWHDGIIMSYSIIIDEDEKDDCHNDSASDLSGFTPTGGSISGEDEKYLSDGVDRLKELVDSGYISEDEEQRRKELIEQFFEYQTNLQDYDENVSFSIVQMFTKCWRGLLRTLRMSR